MTTLTCIVKRSLIVLYMTEMIAEMRIDMIVYSI
jgi:hypothetical protein